MWAYALKTIFEIWNDEIDLYGFICYSFPYFNHEGICLRNYVREPFGSYSLCWERFSLRMLDTAFLCLLKFCSLLLLILI